MDHFKEVSWNAAFINNCVTQSNWSAITEYLKENFVLKKSQDGSPQLFKFNNSAHNGLWELLDTLSNNNKWDCSKSILFQENLKAIRNYIANREVHRYVSKKELNILSSVLDNVDNWQDSELVHKYLLQVIINFLTNPDLVDTLRENFYETVKVRFSHSLDNNRYPVYELAAAMYNFLRHTEVSDTELIKKIVKLYETHPNNDYLIFLMEKVIAESYFWEHYDDFPRELRVCVLRFIEDSSLSDISVSNQGINMLIKKFSVSLDSIFKMDENTVLETSKTVRTISILSSQEQFLVQFQCSRNLLVNAAVLLLNIHRLGKESENCFTPIQKLSEFQENSNEHPAFGLKADLIRIIGNLCWKSKVMQDLARKSDVIPVILDSCNIDAKNPFIVQWAIFAIRNICEDNLDNQKTIENMHLIGSASSQTLEEIGFTLHSDGENTLKIVPLEQLKGTRK